ncbi:heterokaryon incompatibility protein-domain-containing protein, partial [Immersiella caudata]
PVYRYPPLPENHIRVLQLLPNRDGNAQIECNLIDYPFLDPWAGPLLCEAVLCVWGPPPNSHALIADDAPLSIRQNCQALLARLRDPVLPRFLWADAVCINQDDNDENADQAQLMTWIYASARGVIVWLEEPKDGCTSPDDQTEGGLGRALQIIREATEDSSALLRAAPGSETARDMVDALSRRSWFRRIWVLQEVAAAGRVTIMCREREIDSEVFCAGLEVMVSARPGTPGLLRTPIFLIEGAGSRRNRASGMLKTYSLNTQPLLELARMYHGRDATDRRDKTFALRA